MSENMSVREFLLRWRAGEWKSPDLDVQIRAGWFDWLCGDSELPKKTEIMARKVFAIAISRKIDLDNHYVSFKNTWPSVGWPYDDFRICDLKTGDILWTVTQRDHHRPAFFVWGAINNFEIPLAVGSWADIEKFFLEE